MSSLPRCIFCTRSFLSSISAITDCCNQCGDKIIAILPNIPSSQTTLQQRIAFEAESITKLLQQKTTLSDHVTALQQQQTTLLTQVTAIQQQLTTLSNQVTTLQQQKTALSDLLTTLLNKVTTLQQQKTILLNEISTVEQHKTYLTTQYNSVQEIYGSTSITQITDIVATLSQEEVQILNNLQFQCSELIPKLHDQLKLSTIQYVNETRNHLVTYPYLMFLLVQFLF